MLPQTQQNPNTAGSNNNNVHDYSGGQNISVINYNNPTIQIKQEFASPFLASSKHHTHIQSSGASSVQGGQMLRKSYDEDSDF